MACPFIRVGLYFQFRTAVIDAFTRIWGPLTCARLSITPSVPITACNFTVPSIFCCTASAGYTGSTKLINCPTCRFRPFCAAFDPSAGTGTERCELMATDPEGIDAAFYERMRAHFSDEELVELGTFVGMNIGYHTFFGTLKFYPMFSPDGVLVSQEESARIYGDTPVSLQK